MSNGTHRSNFVTEKTLETKWKIFGELCYISDSPRIDLMSSHMDPEQLKIMCLPITLIEVRPVRVLLFILTISEC